MQTEGRLLASETEPQFAKVKGNRRVCEERSVNDLSTAMDTLLRALLHGQFSDPEACNEECHAAS